jgi:hypothetical protein
MKIKLLAVVVLLAGCASTADDPMYKRIDWQKSEEYAACKEQLDEEIAQNKKDLEAYEKKKAAAEKAHKEYDEDAAMAEYNKKLVEYEAAKAAGELALMPLRPMSKEMAIMSSVGVMPYVIPLRRCFDPPEGWSSE